MESKFSRSFVLFPSWQGLYEVLSPDDQRYLARWRAIMCGVAVFVLVGVPVLATVLQPAAST